MPFAVLEMATATPNAPVRAAVVSSMERCETIPPSLLHQPALLLGHLVHVVDVFLDEVLEFSAGQEGVGLRRALDVLGPFGRALHLLHHIDIEGCLIRRHLAGEPYGP